LGQEDTVGGRSSFHRYRKNDIWIDTASACLPVPAQQNYAVGTPDTAGNAPARFAIAETNLTLGEWQPVEQFQGLTNYRGFTAESDGFVFCTLEARNNGERGYATCAVNKTIIAAASVHYYPRNDCFLPYATFCAPYAKGSTVEVNITPTAGQPYFQVWRIPSTSEAWKFTKPETLRLGTYSPLDKDGFVNGVVTIPDNGPRGILRLECIDENRVGIHSYPIASAAVHVWHRGDRFISHSSAMLPIRQGYQIFADWKPTAGAPQAQVYWTRVVPVV
jgi:hypothetical protein